MIEITTAKNGPLLVKGTDVKLQDADGNLIQIDKATFALCRCGKSNNKPFCDGTHKDAGFEG